MSSYPLIFVEGLPGSGKSTISRFIDIQMDRNRIQHRWYHEMAGDHPINLSACFFLTPSQYDKLLVSFPQFSSTLAAAGQRVNGFYFFEAQELKKHHWGSQGPAILHYMQQSMRTMAPDTFMDIALTRWDALVQRMKSEHVNVILDGSFLQYQISGLLLFNTAYDSILQFLNRAYTALCALSPCFIYLSEPSAEQSLRQLIALRGEQFVRSLSMRHDHYPYGLSSPKKGIERYSQYLSEYKQIADAFVRQVDCRTISIDVSGRNWAAYQAAIAEQLGIPLVPDADMPPSFLQQLTGNFANSRTRTVLSIQLMNNKLVLVHEKIFIKKLIPKDKYSYYIEDLGVMLAFIPASDGKMEGLLLSGDDYGFPWAAPGTQYHKISAVE